MISFTGNIKQREDGEVFFDIVSLSTDNPTTEEKKLFNEDIKTLADTVIVSDKEEDDMETDQIEFDWNGTATDLVDATEGETDHE